MSKITVTTTPKNRIQITTGGAGGGGVIPSDLVPIYGHANLAYHTANLSYGSVNSNWTVMNVVYATTNANYTMGNAAYVALNSAYDTVNAVYASANSNWTVQNLVYATVNVAYDMANADYAFTNSAYASINSNWEVQNLVYATVNANYVMSNAGYTTLNTAFTMANAGYITLNAAYGTINAVYASSNSNWTVQNALYTTTNSAYGTINAAYASANSNWAVQNALYTTTNSAYATVNAVYAASNSNWTVQNALYTVANTNYTMGNAAYNTLNAAYATVNANYASSNSNWTVQNLVYATVNAAYTLSNAAYANANSLAIGANNWSNLVGMSANSYAGFMANSSNIYTDATYVKLSAPNQLITGDIGINGNLTVTGETIYANTTQLQVGDSIITLNADLPPTIAPLENAGIEVNRGNKNSNAALLWVESSEKWSLTSNVDQPISTFIASNTDLGKVSDTVNASYASANSNWTVQNLIYATVNAAYVMGNANYTVSNTAYNTTNNVYLYANALHAQINYGWEVQNLVYATLNAAYVMANADYVVTNSAFDTVNAVYASANSNWSVQNTLYATTNAAYVMGNANYHVTNAAFDTTNAVYASANSNWVVQNLVYATVNANYTMANAGYTALNAAFDTVNATYASANSNWEVQNLVYATVNVAYDMANAGYATLNAAYDSSNSNWEVQNLVYATVNANYDMANAGYTALNSAFDTTNAVYASSNSNWQVQNLVYATTNAAYIMGNANYVVTNSAFDTVNAAYASANSNWTVQNLVYATVNANYVMSNAGYTTLNAAYDTTNTVYASANSNWEVQNLVYATTNAAYTLANAAYANANAVAIGANTWANTKLANTNNIWFDGSLNIAQDLYINRNITNVTQIIFNTGTNITPTTPGALTWSQDDCTLHFDMDTPSNVIQHIGQDQYYFVKNQTGETIPKGTAVRFAGTMGASGRLLISKAIANNSMLSRDIMGVAAADITNGSDGFVYSFGKLRGVDTSAFSEGDILYLSSTVPGGYQNTQPTAPNNKIAMAAVIYSGSPNGTIHIRPTPASQLDNDELVELNNLANGDFIRFNSANGRFENFNENATGPAINATAAFAKANAALANTSGTVFDGNLIVSGNANVLSLTTNTYIDFTTLPYNSTRVSYREGRLWYNNDAQTLQLESDNPDFPITVGEREWVRCRNSSGSIIYKGQPVYVTGVHISGNPIHGHHPTIALADASDPVKKEVIGLAGHDIADGAHGYVVIRGWLGNVNTSMLTTGGRIHLGYAAPGTLTNTIPEYPNWPMDVGTCLTSDANTGTLYVTIFDHSFESIRVSGPARVGGDMTVEGDFTVLGTQTITNMTSASLGTQYIYLTVGDSIGNANVTFTGTGLNDLDFTGHYEGIGTTPFYVRITEANGSGDYFSWSYDNFATTEASNTLVLYETSQSLSNGISVYFFSNTGHTIGDTWNASATSVSSDAGFVTNHTDPGRYTHAGLFRDATDGTFRFFNTYDPEPVGNINITNNTFTLANVEVLKIDAQQIFADGVEIGGLIKATSVEANIAFDVANSAFAKANAANVLAYDTGIAANSYSGYMANSVNSYANYVGLSVNTYASILSSNNAVGANNWANTVGVAGNNYTDHVGASANAYATATYYTRVEGTAGYNTTNIAFDTANASYASGNSNWAVQNLVYATVNANYAMSNAGYVVSNAAFDKANASYLQANVDYAAVNSAFTVINAVSGIANTALQNTNVTLQGNLATQGNTTVNYGFAFNFAANAYMYYNSACNSIDFVIN